MDDQGSIDGTNTLDGVDAFVPYDHLASRADLLETTGWLVRETKDPQFFEATSRRKTLVSWTQRVLSWFKKI